MTRKYFPTTAFSELVSSGRLVTFPNFDMGRAYLHFQPLDFNNFASRTHLLGKEGAPPALI